MGRPKTNIGPCAVDGCELPAKCKGMCSGHHAAAWRAAGGKPVNTDTRRGHPLYMIWWERKSRGSLCEAWATSFDAFVAGVGDRPSPTHLLRTLRHKEPYGPDNFEWLAALKRAPGESRKDFAARKWASRRERFPSYESQRGLKRKYGLTPEDYDSMEEVQEGKCAICREPETRINPKTHAPQALAVDHCHNSKRVRALLCWRCNTTLGKVEDSVALLGEMIAYLQKHA